MSSARASLHNFSVLLGSNLALNTIFLLLSLLACIAASSSSSSRTVDLLLPRSRLPRAFTLVGLGRGLGISKRTVGTLDRCFWSRTSARWDSSMRTKEEMLAVK